MIRPSRRVLLVGATGVFGSRLAEMLARLPGIELILAARGEDRLQRLRAALLAEGAAGAVETVIFDRQRPEDLALLRPWLVVDASGPFEQGRYALALAAIHAGAHYVDLADGRAFVAGFASALHEEAMGAGVLAVTGASSTPALSHAALTRITAVWRYLDEVIVVISPGARAPRGLAVMQSILSYVGQGLLVFRGGGWVHAPGWSGLRRFDMPGLGRRWASLCETPDLDLLPRRFAIRDSALFMAGLELGIMHLGLALLSLAVRWRLLPSLRPLARPLRAVAGLLVPFGTDRGGMIVEARGEDGEGRAVRSRWALWAEANAGPSTPAAPAAAIVRALSEDRDMPRGAVTGAGLLSLDEILRELAGLPLATRVDSAYPQSSILFQRLLGRRYDDLPQALRAVHGAVEPAYFRGRAVTRAGRGWVARLLGRIVGLPASGRSDVEVRIIPDGAGESWVRRFGPSGFASRLVDARSFGCFEERFGPLRFAFDLQPTGSGLVWRMTGWRLFLLCLPLCLAPTMHARAEAPHGRYRFSVVVAHRWAGLLFAYRGYLA